MLNSEIYLQSGRHGRYICGHTCMPATHRFDLIQCVALRGIFIEIVVVVVDVGSSWGDLSPCGHTNTQSARQCCSGGVLIFITMQKLTIRYRYGYRQRFGRRMRRIVQFHGVDFLRNILYTIFQFGDLNVCIFCNKYDSPSHAQLLLICK